MESLEDLQKIAYEPFLNVILAAERRAKVHREAAKALESEFCKRRDFINEWRVGYESAMVQLQLANVAFLNRYCALWDIRFKASFSKTLFTDWKYEKMHNAYIKYSLWANRLSKQAGGNNNETGSTRRTND